MSGFFSLGGGFGIGKDEAERQQQQHDHHHNQEQEDSIITPNSLYLFKNEEIYSKGFELWQQYYQLHHQHRHHNHHPQPSSSHYDLGVVGGGRRRSITADDLCLNTSNNNNNHLYASSWNFVERSGGSGDGTKAMRQAGYAGIGGGDHGGGGSGSGGMNCQDCGNQAKKDCQHMRCRTCCKSRGFQCQTHVKSTWVPAAKRRERQQQLLSLTQQQQQQQHNLGNQQLSLMMRGGGSGGAGAGGGIDQNPKRLREDHQLMTTTGGGGGGGVSLNLPSTHHHHHHTSSGLEVGHFPAEVSSPATFRCVRVSAMDEAEEQLAYQTAVSIGGHVFKGILYDRGPEGRYGGDSSSAGGGSGTQHHHQQLNLITSGTMGIATATTTVHPHVASIDPSSIYPTPLNAFMAGTQFFPPPRS